MLVYFPFFLTFTFKSFLEVSYFSSVDWDGFLNYSIATTATATMKRNKIGALFKRRRESAAHVRDVTLTACKISYCTMSTCKFVYPCDLIFFIASVSYDAKHIILY